MLVKLKKVRLSYPQLFEATSFQGEGEKSYSASFIFSKDHPAVKEVENAIETVAKEKWASKADVVLKELRSKDRVCLHDGDSKASADGYSGNLFLNARRKEKDRAPMILDGDKTALTSKDGRPYGGCYVNANVEIYPQDNGFGKRVNATLLGVQFHSDGEPFSGSAPASADDFEMEADEAAGLV